MVINCVFLRLGIYVKDSMNAVGKSEWLMLWNIIASFNQ